MTPHLIGCHNQQNLIEEVLSGLLHPRFSCCYNLIVPPGFGEALLVEGLERGLREHAARPLTAVVAPDEVKNGREFLDRLRHQWIGPEAHTPAADDDDAAFDRLLTDVYKVATGRSPGEPGHPVVLVLKRFHKVLDNLAVSVLGRLRREEQANRLNTATLTHLPYAELKRRWQSKRHIFTVCDYGDTHHQKQAEPLPREAAAAHAAAEGVPEEIADFFWRLTGGFPEPFREVLATWVREGHQQLTRAVRDRLERLAAERLARFVEWLDPEEDRRFRDRLINLHLNPDDQEAYEVLLAHPWKDALLLDEGLRAEALGIAALAADQRDAVARRSATTDWREPVSRARLLYERQQYGEACKLLDVARPPGINAEVEFLRIRALVMKKLCGGDDRSVDDIDWQGLLAALHKAREFLSRFGEALEPDQRTRLANRCDELETLAKRVGEAAGVGGNRQGRIIDILAGFAGKGVARSPKHAALLLRLKYDTARAIPGPARAVREVVELPEQLFRVWAFWRLKLNYYEAPTAQEEVWQKVEQAWPLSTGEEPATICRPVPGQQFPSFKSFVYFATALHRLDGKPTLPAEQAVLEAMERDLSFYEPIRNGKAHAWTLTPEKHRRRYFELIGRWLTLVLVAYPESDSVNETALQMLLEPL
jgi:hypothetical protein